MDATDTHAYEIVLIPENASLSSPAETRTVTVNIPATLSGADAHEAITDKIIADQLIDPYAYRNHWTPFRISRADPDVAAALREALISYTRIPDECRRKTFTFQTTSGLTPTILGLEPDTLEEFTDWSFDLISNYEVATCAFQHELYDAMLRAVVREAPGTLPRVTDVSADNPEDLITFLGVYDDAQSQLIETAMDHTETVLDELAIQTGRPIDFC